MTNLNFAGSSGAAISDALIGPQLDYRQQVLIRWKSGVVTEISDLLNIDPSNLNFPLLDGVLAPGLIDSHVHLGLDGSGDVVGNLQNAPQDLLRERIRSNRRAYLLAGITTVRDLGCPLSLLTSDNTLRQEAPDLSSVIAAQAISSATGHGNFVSKTAESLADYKRIIDDLDPQATPFIKLFASGGVITKGTNPGSVQMSEELLEQVVTHAHRRGFLIAAHAHSRKSIQNAIRANVNTIEHFSYLHDDDLDEIDDSNSWLVSTYIATKRFVSQLEHADTEPEAREKIIRHAPSEFQSLQRSVAISRKILAGSDSGTILNPHPFGLLEQTEQMLLAGFSSQEALMSITSRAGEALGARIGQISEGYAADFVLLPSNPISDPSALSKIKTVIKHGKVLGE
jgi:imidazolonepropionase-like amidohydrolase